MSWTGQECFYVTPTLDFLQRCGLVTSHVPQFGDKPLKICERVYPGKREKCKALCTISPYDFVLHVV